MGIQVFLLPQAIEDLEEIYEPLYSHVIDKLRLLSEFPSLGPALTGPFTGYRCLTVELFRVVYRIVSPTEIHVAYIRHTRRQPLKHL